MGLIDFLKKLREVSFKDAPILRTISSQETASLQHYYNTVWNEYLRNPIFSRVVDELIDGLYGEGLVFKGATKRIDSIYRNFINLNPSSLLHDIVFQAVLYGGCLIEASLLPTGYYKIISIIPFNLIQSIEFVNATPHKVNYLTPEELEEKEVILANLNAPREDKAYWLLAFNIHKGTALPLPFKVFNLARQYNQFLLNMLELYKQFKFFLDIEGENLTPEIIEELRRIEEGNLKESYSLRIHTADIKYNFKAPDFNIRGFEFIEERIRHAILGALGMGAHHFAAGEDINRATAREMKEPFERTLRRYREIIKKFWRDVITYQMVSLGVSNPKFTLKFRIFDNAVIEGMEKVSNFIKQLSPAIEYGIIRVDEARRLLGLLLEEFGLEEVLDEEE